MFGDEIAAGFVEAKVYGDARRNETYEDGTA
jgi:hypothetical protein